MLYPKLPSKHLGWAGGYHKHHDHAGDKYLRGGRPAGFSPRFEPTVICEQCNSADGAVKRKLNLPQDFSFTPLEIRAFVKPQAHGKHLIDYRVAESIYSLLRPGQLNSSTASQT